MKLLFLPTWLLLMASWKFLPEDHFLKVINRGRIMTLGEWYRGSQPLNMILNVMMWISIYNIFLLAYLI